MNSGAGGGVSIRRSDGIVILGIDPGLQTTGYGLVRVGWRPELIEAGTIEGGPSGLGISARLKTLHAGMMSLVVEHRPRAVAMEQLYSHYAHPRTAILMGHARGVLALVAAVNDIEVIDYAATEVKNSLTGNGRATKAQMQRAVQAALCLTHPPEPADAADALALALCHATRVGRQALS